MWAWLSPCPHLLYISIDTLYINTDVQSRELQVVEVHDFFLGMLVRIRLLLGRAFLCWFGSGVAFYWCAILVEHNLFFDVYAVGIGRVVLLAHVVALAVVHCGGDVVVLRFAELGAILCECRVTQHRLQEVAADGECGA